MVHYFFVSKEKVAAISICNTIFYVFIILYEFHKEKIQTEAMKAFRSGRIFYRGKGAVMQLTRKELVREQCYVNGKWISASDKKTFEVSNPATGGECAFSGQG